MQNKIGMQNKTLYQYPKMIQDQFPHYLENAQPQDLRSQEFIIQLQARFERFGTDVMVTAKQLGWLIDLQPRNSAQVQPDLS